MAFGSRIRGSMAEPQYTRLLPCYVKAGPELTEDAVMLCEVCEGEIIAVSLRVADKAALKWVEDSQK